MLNSAICYPISMPSWSYQNLCEKNFLEQGFDFQEEYLSAFTAVMSASQYKLT